MKKFAMMLLSATLFSGAANLALADEHKDKKKDSKKEHKEEHKDKKKTGH
ncbi:MAG: hypothetical protein SFV18_01205 [Bryobacteraceae bacterium]|nr:hypothetical protein [Bryobacteraceae bacterium]